MTGSSTQAQTWPPKHNVLGVRVSATTYADALGRIMAAAQEKRPAIVDHMAVHGLVLASRERRFGAQIERFDMVCPDGQPVRWALNLLHRTRLPDRVYGPDLMLLLCERAAREGVPVYLYGSTPAVLGKLSARLQQRFPGLEVAGHESPPFRRLTEEEDRAAVQRINASNAGVVFLGLGCPKQERFAFEHRDTINAVQVCVGAAFAFIAGTKPQAPAWMQRAGLEWLFRLCSEPRRLWKRYVFTNLWFLFRVSVQLVSGR